MTNQLITDAKNWQAEKNNTITSDGFYQRIQLSEISFYNDGSFEVIFEDDGIFFGHIIVSGHIDGELEDASIAG